MNMQIIKKNGNREPFDASKIVTAVDKSASRAEVVFTDEQHKRIIDLVLEKMEMIGNPEVPVDRMHTLVELALDEVNPKVSKQYRDYRNYKQEMKEDWAEANGDMDAILYRGDKSNGNADSSLNSTISALESATFHKTRYKRNFLTEKERNACKTGYIYIHDMSRRGDMINCCLFRVGHLLKNGFEMGNIKYTEPKTLDVAFDVIADIVMSAASQQYGGFTLPQVDKILSYYAEKSYKLYYDEEIGKMEAFAKRRGLELTDEDRAEADRIATEKVAYDYKQGFQGWEIKFNTVGSSRGDYPFVTVTAGLDTSKFGRMGNIIMYDVHKGGQGEKGKKKPVLFPKYVFLYDEELHGEGKELRDVYEAGLDCSHKAMYPDWLSLTGEGYVPSMYKKYNAVISPMGCLLHDEVITYKYNNILYIESFGRFWDRIASENPIEEQFKGNKDYLYIDTSKLNLKIYDTLKGFTKVNTFIRNLSNNFVRVKFSNGRNAICTDDHPFETINRGVVHAKDLQTTDKIIINNHSYSEENMVVDDDYAWLLGLLLCDGCYQNHSIFVSIAENSENEIEERFHRTFEKCFGLKTKTVIQHRGIKGNYKDLRVIGDGDCKMAEIIKTLTNLFGGVNKKDRHIPNEVFSWNYSAKMSFFAGIIDADGCVKEHNNTKNIANTVTFGSVNRELALQEMCLAQSLGYPTKIYINHYRKNEPEKIRYKCETIGNSELTNYLTCSKKADRIIETEDIPSFNTEAQVISVETLDITDFSYDVSTDSEHFEVNGLYSHNCRAFLSPWYKVGKIQKNPDGTDKVGPDNKPLRDHFYPAEDMEDEPVFEGRFNSGAISLNLPLILLKSRAEDRAFYDVLDEYLEMIRQVHIRTRDHLLNVRASTNPLGFCEGGFYGGNLKWYQKLKENPELIDSTTWSFGITALNELQQAYNGKSITEDGAFAKSVLEYINDKAQEFKEKDHMLYAIYGTPAESLCGLQIKQIRNYTKYHEAELKAAGYDIKLQGEDYVIPNVSDRAYVSNSFHCHVTEDISPIMKQDLENRFWNLSNGGKIQYVRYPNGHNKEAMRTLIDRAMQKGFYEGCNMALSYCDNCGHEELEMDDKCPCCGSTDLTKIDRMNGYLSYSRVKGDTRLNDAKMAEIAERKSM